MHGAVPAFHGDPQFGIDGGTFRHGQAGTHAVRGAEEDHPGGTQAARLADAQVGGLDLVGAGGAEGGVEELHRAGRVGAWAFVAEFGQREAPGSDLYVAGHPLADAGVAAKQRGIGEVLGHEAQRYQQQQDIDVETPFQPEGPQR